MPQLISTAANSPFIEFDTLIAELGDKADIVEAFRIYHYGKENYITGEEPSDESIYGHLLKIREDIDFIEATPTGGGTVAPNIPHELIVQSTSISIPEGFMWIDSDASSLQVIESGTATLTNNMPSVGGASAHGVVWVDKDQVMTDPFVFSNFLTTQTIGTELAAYLTIASASATYVPITGGTISNATSITLAGAQPLSARVRNITASTSDPTGGNDGDIWIKYV
jgi:hypothetical protein